MRLLIVTQAVDLDNPVLGFFHEWIAALAQRTERVTVICLYEGRHELPENVAVYSLGKEKGSVSPVVYGFRFLRLVWKARMAYEAAFVHMNQEYVLLAGLLWKALGKRIYMWRNHYAGSFLTDIAAAFCTKVFCTSRHSYTAKYAKTSLMPVGVDLDQFQPGSPEERRQDSILFLARMSPSKNPLMLLDALKELHEEGRGFRATFVGSPLPEHEAYYRSLTHRAGQYGLVDKVSFMPGITKEEAASFFRTHAIFVNCSRSGMFDKTLFEAAASGCRVLAVSDDFGALAGARHAFRDTQELAARLRDELALPVPAVLETEARMRTIARDQSLARLADELEASMIAI